MFTDNINCVSTYKELSSVIKIKQEDPLSPSDFSLLLRIIETLLENKITQLTQIKGILKDSLIL